MSPNFIYIDALLYLYSYKYKNRFDRIFLCIIFIVKILK